MFNDYCDIILCIAVHDSPQSINVIIYGIIRICESSVLDGEIELLVGFGPGGRFARLHHDLMHNGFELKKFFTKRAALVMSDVC